MEQEKKSNPRDRRRGDPARAGRCCGPRATARWRCSTRQSGAPLASRVAVATDLDGTPLILVSSLSEHTGGAARRPALLAAARRARQGRSAGASAHQPALPGRAAGARHAGRRRAPSGAISTAIPRPSSMPASAISPSSAWRSSAPASMAASARPIMLDARRSRFRRPGKRRTRRGRTAGARPHERRPPRRDRRLCARLRQGGRRRMVAHRHRRRRHRHRVAATTAGGSSSPNRSPARQNCARLWSRSPSRGDGSIAHNATEIREQVRSCTCRFAVKHIKLQISGLIQADAPADRTAGTPSPPWRSPDVSPTVLGGPVDVTRLAENADDAAALLALLANGKRLTIIEHLLDREMSVGAIAKKVVAQPVCAVAASGQAAQPQSGRDAARPADDLLFLQVRTGAPPAADARRHFREELSSARLDACPRNGLSLDADFAIREVMTSTMPQSRSTTPTIRASPPIATFASATSSAARAASWPRARSCSTCCFRPGASRPNRC